MCGRDAQGPDSREGEEAEAVEEEFWGSERVGSVFCAGVASSEEERSVEMGITCDGELTSVVG